MRTQLSYKKGVNVKLCPAVFCRQPGTVVATLVLVLLPCASVAAGFGFANVQAAAEQLARQDYKKPADDLPPALASLTHEQYSAISYAPAARLWRSSRGQFSVGFLTRGNNYHDSVKINVVDATGVHPVAFDAGDCILLG